MESMASASEKESMQGSISNFSLFKRNTLTVYILLI